MRNSSLGFASKRKFGTKVYSLDTANFTSKKAAQIRAEYLKACGALTRIISRPMTDHTVLYATYIYPTYTYRIG